MAEQLPFRQPADDSPGPFRRPAETATNDPEWLIRQAFKQSHEQGYERLFRTYYRILCSHAVRYTYSRTVAEDIVGEVFLNFWQNQTHTHITTSFSAYLFTAVRNRVFSYLSDENRKKNVFGSSADEASEPTETADPQSILQFTELYQRIEELIRTLPPQCQRVFLLSRFEGRKHREIADELQISLKTVEMHVTRALSEIRRALWVGIVLFFQLLTHV